MGGKGLKSTWEHTAKNITKTKFQGVGNDLSDDYVEEELPRGGAGRSRARLLKKAEAHRFPHCFPPLCYILSFTLFYIILKGGGEEKGK